jgi:small-conductance mechanosensitive channel/outer membrane murein-binding lipoprotein Lpp
MEILTSFFEQSRLFLPLIATVASVGAVLAATSTVLQRRYGDSAQTPFRARLILITLTFIGILAIILSLPVDDTLRGQLLSFLGILLSATIALSSTTFLGNALAGILLRVVAGFRIGDFIRVGEYFGRVSERDLFHTEIQTEDRDLTTLPNLFLVTHPVRVVRASGTIVSATVSLGYDVSRQMIEESLLTAATTIGLEDPFVQIMDLGDFSVTYRIAGLLTDVKHLLSTRSALRAAVLDTLHGSRIEIVSPTFMNQRLLDPKSPILPPTAGRRSAEPERDSRAPEAVVFDKAEEAEKIEDLSNRHRGLQEQIAQLEEEFKAAETDSARKTLEAQIAKLDADYEQLGLIIERSREEHSEA